MDSAGSGSYATTDIMFFKVCGYKNGRFCWCGYSSFHFKLSFFVRFFGAWEWLNGLDDHSKISNITMSDWFENFLVSYSIIFSYTQSQPYLDYLSSILEIFAYQSSSREDLDKSVLSVYTWSDVEEETG